MVSEETKRDRFVRVAEARTNKIIRMIKLLGNCSNTSAYDYNKSDVDRIFNAINLELLEAKKRFEKVSKTDLAFKLEKGR